MCTFTTVSSKIYPIRNYNGNTVFFCANLFNRRELFSRCKQVDWMATSAPKDCFPFRHRDQFRKNAVDVDWMYTHTHIHTAVHAQRALRWRPNTCSRTAVCDSILCASCSFGHCDRLWQIGCCQCSFHFLSVNVDSRLSDEMENEDIAMQWNHPTLTHTDARVRNANIATIEAVKLYTIAHVSNASNTPQMECINVNFDRKLAVWNREKIGQYHIIVQMQTADYTSTLAFVHWNQEHTLPLSGSMYT